MQARRRRQHPHEFGRASTYVETVEGLEFEEDSRRFLQELDYYGLVELEYKLDQRDGRYKLLDFNARTWGYHTLGAAAGVDFAALLFADQLGQTVLPVRARAGVSWRRLVTDVPATFVDLCDRPTRPDRVPAHLLQQRHGSSARSERPQALADGAGPAPVPDVEARFLIAVAGTDANVVVVGAGPYGLTAGALLRRAGVPVEVFGDPLSFWKEMPSGLCLRSNWGASSFVEQRGPSVARCICR